MVVYRKKASDSFKVFSMIKRIIKAFSIEASIDETKKIIEVNDYHITPFCGPVWKMGGIRPFLYNTDCKYASEILEQGASKVDGREIENLEELVRIILEV